MVPSTAFLSGDLANHLYVLAGDGNPRLVKLRRVEPGLAVGPLSAISNGVEAGDVVVTWGQNLLEDGDPAHIHLDLSADYFGTEGGAR